MLFGVSICIHLVLIATPQAPLLNSSLPSRFPLAGFAARFCCCSAAHRLWQGQQGCSPKPLAGRCFIDAETDFLFGNDVKIT